MFIYVHSRMLCVLASCATLVVLMLSLLPSTAFSQAEDVPTLKPDASYIETQKKVVRYLTQKHYNKKPLDDEHSSAFFDAYLLALDPSRIYLNQSDVSSFEQYRFTLDDAVSTDNMAPAYHIYTLFAKKRTARLNKLLNLLKGGVDQFSFERDEYYELDRSESSWALDDVELDDLWRKRVKASVISMLLQPKTKEELITTLTKRYEGSLRRSAQVTSDDVFQTYINALTQLYDPHTQYLLPKTSENFHINMSLSLEGIGALLKLEDEYTTVSSLVPAGPAEKGGALKPNDRIISVGQNEVGEMVDIVGWRLDNVVELIRGPKGSIVRLEIASDADPKPRIISIKRNTVQLQEQSAKVALMKIEQDQTEHTFAVIDIPIFYSDFSCIQGGAANCRSTTRDVYSLLEQLQDRHPEGIIIDLRNNGGGSLQEANGLTGLFVGPGPTVQVRDNKNRVDVFSNTGSKAFYNSPLIVLTNRLSASASEIFAGAIQDYGRGLVVGTRTYGKGTVQVLANLNPGQLKITQAKFYRISGLSTQHTGVTPDIKLPAIYNPEDIGESTLDYALSGDVIRRARYRQHYQIKSLIKPLSALHDSRAAKDKGLQYIENFYARNKQRREQKFVSLNLTHRQDEDHQSKTWRLKQENIKRTARCLLEVVSIEELEDLNAEDAPSDLPIAGCQTDPNYGVATLIEEFHTNQMGSTPTVAKNENTEPALLASANTDVVEQEDDSVDDSLLVETARILIDYIRLQKQQAGLNP